MAVFAQLKEHLVHRGLKYASAPSPVESVSNLPEPVNQTEPLTPDSESKFQQSISEKPAFEAPQSSVVFSNIRGIVLDLIGAVHTTLHLEDQSAVPCL